MMAGRLLLDTDVVIEYLRNRPQAQAYVERLDAGTYLSAATVAELFAGLRNDAERLALQYFLLAFETVPIDADVARTGGDYRRLFGPSHGTGLVDGLIAACAERIGATLVTFNVRHYPMLSNVQAPYERS